MIAKASYDIGKSSVIELLDGTEISEDMKQSLLKLAKSSNLPEGMTIVDIIVQKRGPYYHAEILIGSTSKDTRVSSILEETRRLENIFKTNQENIRFVSFILQQK